VIALLVLWIAALLLLRSRADSAPTPARRWNLGFLLLTILTAYTSCAAPIVQLIAGFRAVADVAPEYKTAVLSQQIDDTRPAMLLSLVTIPVLILGITAFVANRRKIRRRQREQAVVDAF
jgi:hypothetical protein